MTRTHLEILTIIVVIASVIGLAIIGLMLIATIPSYYVAVLVGLILLFLPYFMDVVSPALGIISLVMMILIGGTTIGLIVRKATAHKGWLIATTAGVVSGGTFVILVGIFQVMMAVLL